jgi:translation initiation factor 1
MAPMGDEDAGFNNPFAALQGLGKDLPKQEKRAEPEKEKAPEGPAALSGKIVLRREKKGRGGKTVTRVTGLPPSRLDELCKKMKKGLGCGAKVEGEDLVLLGELTDRGAHWLRDAGASQVVIGN